MARKLSQEEIVTLKTLHEKGQSNVEIGRTLGVTEGAVRYHLRRAVTGVADGRSRSTSRRRSPGCSPGARSRGRWRRSGARGGSAGGTCAGYDFTRLRPDVLQKRAAMKGRGMNQIANIPTIVV